MDYKGELKLVFKLSGKGRFLTSKMSFGWIEESNNTVINLPLLIDKPYVKLTDTCVGH